MADDPRPAPEALAELVSRQDSLAARVGEVEAEQRAAVEAARDAADALVELERSAANGEKVTDAARREAEDALLQAKTAAAAPWAERERAARLAVQDAGFVVRSFVAEHLTALLAELAVEGERVAQEQDAAARVVVAAYRERANVEQRVFGLLSMVGQTRPGDVQRSKAEALAREAERLIASGGEAPPSVVVRPGEPRYPAASVA